MVHRLIREGIDIRGYFWWSVMDNCEWLEGLRPRFGLYRVDFGTLERKATAAAYFTRWVRRRRIRQEGDQKKLNAPFTRCLSHGRNIGQTPM